VKIVYDPDIPPSIRPSIQHEIKNSVHNQCECGCDEIYVYFSSKDIIDVKCYDCGHSFFELKLEIDDSPEKKITIR